MNKWARKSRIIVIKKHTKVKTILEVHTLLISYALYEKEREYCDKNNIRIGSKNICVEYVKKIGFLVGAYVKIVLLKYCIKELGKIRNIKKGTRYKENFHIWKRTEIKSLNHIYNRKRA